MELVMIVQEGCGPCDAMKVMAPSKAELKGYSFRIVQLEPMPKDIRPPNTPYFYIMDGDKIVEEWGGPNMQKLSAVLERNKKENNNE